MTERRVDKRLLAPVLMGFFIMGFCDIVAPVTNIISGEFAESQQSAVSFLPSMVFLWFLLLSTPVAALMNRIGRKRTAMIGYAFTIAGLLVPYAAGVGSALSWYFIGFGLLGIGNTAIQVAVNPLLATIVKSDTVRVDFSMTALDYLRSKARNVNLGHKDSTRNWDPYITVTLADNTHYPLRGLVDFADPQVDPNTGTFSVRAEMANPDHILLPGQFTKVRLLLDVRENAIVVPNKAIVIEKGGAHVFVVRPDSVVEKRFIELGPEIENKAVVERGLTSGERIVVEGYHKLASGMRVEVVKPQPEAGQTPKQE